MEYLFAIVHRCVCSPCLSFCFASVGSASLSLCVILACCFSLLQALGLVRSFARLSLGVEPFMCSFSPPPSGFVPSPQPLAFAANVIVGNVLDSAGEPIGLCHCARTKVRMTVLCVSCSFDTVSESYVNV